MIQNDLECRNAMDRLAAVRKEIAEKRRQVHQGAQPDPELEQLNTTGRQLEEEIAKYQSRIAATWRPGSEPLS